MRAERAALCISPSAMAGARTPPTRETPTRANYGKEARGRFKRLMEESVVVVGERRSMNARERERERESAGTNLAGRCLYYRSVVFELLRGYGVSTYILWGDDGFVEGLRFGCLE